MSIMKFLRSRRTWIGVLLFIILCIIGSAIGALLIVKGIVPITAAQSWVWCSVGIAAFAVGLYTMTGYAVLPTAGVTWAILMLLLAGSGCLLPCGIAWGKPVIGTSCAVLAGLILAGILCCRLPGKKHGRAGKRHTAKLRRGQEAAVDAVRI